jgi:PAS domain-containing protein
MILDVRTMYIAVAAVCFINAVTLSVVLGGVHRRDGTFLWSLGWTLQGCAWALMALRGLAWDFLSIVVYVTALSAAFSLFYLAVREHQGRPHSRTLLFLPPSAIFVFSWYFSLVVNDVAYRSFFVSIPLIVQVTALVWALFWKAPASERRSSWLTGFAFVLADGVFLSRFVGALALPPGQMSVLTPGPVRGATLVAGLGVVLLANIGFLLMTRQKTETILREKEEHYRSLFDSMLNGYAHCKMLFDGDEPVDFVYLEVNRAFENLTGLRNVAGKRVSEVIPGIRRSDPELFKVYGKIGRAHV